MWPVNLCVSSYELPNCVEPLSYIIEDEKPIVLNFEETNGVYKPKGNFSVEVFEVVSGAISKQLYFIPDVNSRAEDDFIKASEEQLVNRYPDLTKNFVEYFLDIRVDREVLTDSELEAQRAGVGGVDVTSDIYTGADDDGSGEGC